MVLVCFPPLGLNSVMRWRKGKSLAPICPRLLGGVVATERSSKGRIIGFFPVSDCWAATANAQKNPSALGKAYSSKVSICPLSFQEALCNFMTSQMCVDCLADAQLELLWWCIHSVIYFPAFGRCGSPTLRLVQGAASMPWTKNLVKD